MSDDKEVKLTDRQYSEIKSVAMSNWVNYNKGDINVVVSVIDSFISFCNKNKYIVKDGKVIQKDEQKE